MHFPQQRYVTCDHCEGSSSQPAAVVSTMRFPGGVPCILRKAPQSPSHLCGGMAGEMVPFAVANGDELPAHIFDPKKVTGISLQRLFLTFALFDSELGLLRAVPEP